MSFISLETSGSVYQTGLTHDMDSSAISESALPIMENKPVVPPAEPKDEVDHEGLVDRSKWISWYLGAPGTLFGTVVGIVLVLCLQQVPSIAQYARENAGFGDYFHAFGALYFRALSCVTIPLAFVNVTMCVADIVASKMKLKLRLLSLTCVATVLAIGQGALWCHFFSQHFNGSPYILSGSVHGSSIADLEFACPNSTAMLLQNSTTNELYCGSGAPSTTEFVTTSPLWALRPSVVQILNFADAFDEITNAIYLLIPDNMVSMLENNNVVGLATLAILFGIAFGVSSRRNKGDYRPVDILRELHAIFKTMLAYVTAVTPIAIMPLFAAPLLAGTHSVSVDGPRLLVFLGTFLLAGAIHCLIVLPVLLVVFTGTNPYRFFKTVKDALFYGFSCSSSSKSVPVATRSMDTLSGNRNVARLSASIGTCINKSGGALYVSMALVWTFRNAGLYAEVTFVKMCVICVLSFVASLAIPPVRTGGVAIVISLFTFLSGVPITYSYSFLLVAECLLDPLATVMNLWGNLLVARITSFTR
ncbi:Aste57867_21976 [Aphanomyces stellatus]|uniref:Amino acid transporter n=1 Tax=Aphanomyces stellatus TaxID=120398 RepID=A0A485LKA8_9STRA|nr:hypothetical protein As57867_021907 [Aphanomyces stellatus]VFT98644.1 Aste57867_21976 [Aphanomyces stellatus]